MRTIIVGEAPVAATVGLEALGPEGRSGARLARLLGCERASQLALTANLFDEPQISWDAASAAERAAQLLLSSSASRWILCGRKVADAFDVRCDWMTWRILAPGRLAAVVPHPSGLTRWYNEPANVERAQTFLRAAVSDMAWA